MSSSADSLINDIINKNPNQPEFLQAVQEVLEDISPIISSESKYRMLIYLKELS